MEQYPARLSRFFKDEIQLDSDVWLTFHRESCYQGSGEDAVVVSIVDNFNQTTTVLATFFSGRWIASAPYHSRAFWDYAKEHKSSIHRILERLTLPMKDLQPMKLEWKCLRRRFRLESLKVTRKIKNLY